MKHVISYLVFSIFILFSLYSNASNKEKTTTLTINLNKKGAEIAPSMYGIFFEEINHAGDGGLYPELVKNRSFEELEMPEGYYAKGDTLYPKRVINHQTGRVMDRTYKWTKEPVPGWRLDSTSIVNVTMEMSKDNPKYSSAPNNLKVIIKDATKPARLINDGYWGMGVKGGDKYFFRTIIRPSSDYKGKIKVKLLSKKNILLASTIIDNLSENEWNDINTELVPSADDSQARLELEFTSSGTVWLDYVSLFPQKTFNKRPNGLRQDLVEMLIGLKPAFVRWPGGCVVEGISLENRYEWKKTLGDPAARPGEYSTWGYRCSYGFGYYEFLQFCEDINADAMYVCNVGLGCHNRMGDACTTDEVSYYVQDCLDAIEYAIGDVNTTWGAKRAEDGHPKPFPLKYVEIGNENRGDLYDERFDIFYAVLKEKYPDLIYISNHGLRGTGNITKTDMIDPHWYVAPDFFFKNSTIFDEHPRGNYTVYVGEYACNRNVGGGNMMAALSEAAFICGMERNGDLVTMTSYAPLLENKNDRRWAVNLIWFDTDEVVGRSSYYVQKMAADHKPTYMVEMSPTENVPENELFSSGIVEPVPLQLFSSGYDETTEELILKVVNAQSCSYPVKFKIDGAQSVCKEGKVISLSAGSATDENSFETPRKIYPAESGYRKFGKEFEYSFLPFSYTVLRVKVNKGKAVAHN